MRGTSQEGPKAEQTAMRINSDPVPTISEMAEPSCSKVDETRAAGNGPKRATSSKYCSARLAAKVR